LFKLDCRSLRSVGVLRYLVIGIGRFGRAWCSHIQWSNAQRPLKKREALGIRPSSTAQCLRRTLLKRKSRTIVVQLIALHRLLPYFALLVVDLNTAVV